ncbi:early nodulin-like protein 1 [Momordica charantia]|uniref:Early nodulin-like protein 1 n=1 Tax=Momordica charantia TaxID=3673 RepID=A0A6J1BRH8_MOMCH|nr:early nodulin-like protein 1 [Momordica charantia]
MAGGLSRALLLLVFLLFSFSEGREMLVGGKNNAWKIPSSQTQSLNHWAETSRFRVGDTLVWNYEEGKDSVLRVGKEDYEVCNTSNPQQKFDDGNTKVELDKPGPFYFISGAKGHCEQGQKLVVVVLTPRRRFVSISPAPSPAELEGPAVAPSSGAAGLKAGVLALLLGVLGLGFANFV